MHVQECSMFESFSPPLTKRLCSSEISSINTLPLRPVTTNKSFCTGLLLPDSSLISLVQTCRFILSIILGWIILLIALPKTAHKVITVYWNTCIKNVEGHVSERKLNWSILLILICTYVRLWFGWKLVVNWLYFV